MCLRREQFFRGLLSLSSQDRCFVAALWLIGCVGAVGCCTTPTPTPIPRCPEPSDEMLVEIVEGSVPPATLEHLARQENICWAILRLDR